MQAIVSSSSHDLTLSLPHAVCVSVCVLLHVRSPNICVGACIWVCASFVSSLPIHTLVSPQIELSEGSAHLPVRPAHECCYPISSRMLTKRSIGFWAVFTVAHCIIYITACCSCIMGRGTYSYTTTGLINVGIIIHQTDQKNSSANSDPAWRRGKSTSSVMDRAKWCGYKLRLFDACSVEV